MRRSLWSLLLVGFTTAPICAQPDALPGIWQTGDQDTGESSRLQLSGDGTFRWQITFAGDLDEFFGFDFEEFEGGEEFDEGQEEEGDEEEGGDEEDDGEEEGEDLEEEGDLQDEEEAAAAFFAFLLLSSFSFGEGEFTSIIEGEWQVDGDELTLTGHVTDMLINGQPLEKFFEEAFVELIATLAALEEAFAGEGEEEDEEELSDEQVEAALAEAVQTISSAFAEVASEELVELFTFSVEGDELTLTNEDEEARIWARVPLSSAVEAVSWGQVKAMGR